MAAGSTTTACSSRSAREQSGGGIASPQLRTTVAVTASRSASKAISSSLRSRGRRTSPAPPPASSGCATTPSTPPSGCGSAWCAGGASSTHSVETSSACARPTVSAAEEVERDCEVAGGRSCGRMAPTNGRIDAATARGSEGHAHEGWRRHATTPRKTCRGAAGEGEGTGRWMW
eukprot:scaffold106897_cov36-Phaeocystis_antarctica.AAC.1